MESSGVCVWAGLPMEIVADSIRGVTRPPHCVPRYVMHGAGSDRTQAANSADTAAQDREGSQRALDRRKQTRCEPALIKARIQFILEVIELQRISKHDCLLRCIERSRDFEKSG